MRYIEFVELRERIGESMAILEKTLSVSRERIDFPKEMRPALAEDIRAGRIIYYISGDNGPFCQIITSVLYPDSAFKAFVGDDGCRYGLSGAWVEQETGGEVK